MSDLIVPTDETLEELEQMGVNLDFEAGVPTSRIYPGVYDFTFELVPITDRATGQELPGGLGEQIVNGEVFKKIGFTAHILAASVPEDHFLKRVDDESIPARFLSASNFVIPFRKIHDWFALYRCLGLVQTIGNPANDSVTLKRLRAASGTATGRAEFIWRLFHAPTTITYSTSPRKKEKAFPLTGEKFANGQNKPVDRLELTDDDEEPKLFFPNLDIGSYLVPRPKKD